MDTKGTSSDFTDLLQQAVNAIGSYRQVLQNQLPAPVSSLTDLKGVNGLDTALAARAATYVIQQLGDNNYQQVRAAKPLSSKRTSRQRLWCPCMVSTRLEKLPCTHCVPTYQ